MIFGDQDLTQEFDPGSGRTLAACLTHASRTEIEFNTEGLRKHRVFGVELDLSGGRVSNA